MTGSLQKKNEKYYAVLNFYDENKKRKQKWIDLNLSTKGNNVRKAQQKLRSLITEYENQDITYTNITFVDFMKKWLESKPDIRDNTKYIYQLAITSHIKPYFKEKKLQDIKPIDIQQYYNFKLKTLSENTVLKHHATISGCLKYAVRMNLIPYNHAERVLLPKKQKYFANYYTKEQINNLFECVEGNDLELLIKMTAIYGLRRSEIVGLRWQSIDFEKHTIHINHTAVCSKGGVIYDDRTKTVSSNRFLPLTAEIEIKLLQLKCQQENDKKLFGNTYKDNDYVFKWKDGKPYKPEYITRQFNKILKENDSPKIRLHDLRHSAASLLVDLGFSLKEIQEYLGHSNISTTADIYAHLKFESKRNIVKTMNEKLNI